MKLIIGPAAEGEFYFDRPYLNDLFWKKLKESHNLSIAAPRRVGKSSFMLNLLKNEKSGFHCSYIITESINEPNEFFKKLYKTLLGLLNTSGKFKQFFDDLFKRLEIKKISLSEIEFGRNEIDYYDEILLLCKEVKETDATIILLIDEFSQTVENIITDESREVAKNFLHQCRELRQSPDVKGRISFVYTGSIGLENLVLSIDEPRSISDLGHFTIPPLSEEALGGEAQAQQFQQVATTATADLGEVQSRQVAQVQLCEQPQQRTLALLQRLPDVGTLHAVAATVMAARIALDDGAGFRLVHLRASMKRCASTG